MGEEARVGYGSRLRGGVDSKSKDTWVLAFSHHVMAMRAAIVIGY